MFTNFPKYYRNALTQVSETGFICVITFWEKQMNVFQTIDDKEKVIVIGNLYTKQGLEFVIRNLFLCPSCEMLLFVGHDKNNITPLLKEGFKDLPLEDKYLTQFWNYFRNNIFFAKLNNLNEVINSAVRKNQPWINEPIEIPEPVKVLPSSYPSEKMGFVLRDSCLERLWKRILTKINLFGCVKGSDNDNSQKELMGVVSVLTGPNIVATPAMPSFEILDTYVPQVTTAAGDDKLSYTYGSRLYGERQVETLVAELRVAKHSRRAIAFTWRIEKDLTSKFPPCLILINCNIQGDELFMTGYFRSQDMYNAYCMNAYALKQLQRIIVADIGDPSLKDGPLMIVSNSAHVYERNFRDIADMHELDCNLDPRGYFAITTTVNDEDDEKKKIVINYFDNTDNQLLYTASGADPHKLCDAVQPFVSEVSHALYVGRELMRARQCLDMGVPYVQE